MDQLRAERIPCTPHLMDGPAAETILRFAETQKIDEIIMGSRGLGAIGNFLLGSVSSKVAHLAAIPVTLVK
jgi:nucleotide-binding universal stress UspA family protein